MSVETNKELVRHFLEAPWKYEKLVALDQFLTPDFVLHNSIADLHGIAEFRAAVAEELEALADVVVSVEEMIAEGDRVAVRYTTSFMQQGEFMHAYPTGTWTNLRGVSIYRIADGKIAETWEAYDRRSAARDRGTTQRVSDEDDAAIRRTVEEALRIGFDDRPALAEHYWAKTAEVIASSGETVRGRQNVLAWLQRFPTVSSWKLFDLTIDGAGEFAFVRGRYAIELSKRAKLPFDRGQYLEIWNKQSDGSWKVARCVYNSELAARTRHRAALAAATP